MADRDHDTGDRSPASGVRSAPEGGYLRLDNWRNRVWYPALEAAGISKRGPYHLRHTFATEALAAGVSTSSCRA